MRSFPPPITNRKIRFAVVGCGRIATNHFNAIKQHAERAELVGICDVDPNALQRAATETGAHPYATMGELLQTSDADVVVLTTPSGLHPSQVIEVASAGRHAMTEKPMATRWHDGLRMVKACDDASVRLFVVKQNRYNLPVQKVMEAHQQARFGKLVMGTVRITQKLPLVAGAMACD